MKVRTPTASEVLVMIVAVSFAIPLAIILSSVLSNEARDITLLQQNRELLQRIERLEQQGNDDVMQHRDANDQAHGEICRIIEDIVRTRQIMVERCEFQRLNPAPAPTP